MKWLSTTIMLVLVIGAPYYTALWAGLLDTKGCFKVTLDNKTFHAKAYRQTNRSYIFKLANGGTIEAFKENVKVRIETTEQKKCKRGVER